MRSRVVEIARARGAEVAFTLVALVAWVFLRDDYGTSWDEAVHLRFGEAVRRYFAGGFDYSAVATYPVANLRLYSHTVDLLAAWIAHLAGQDLFTYRHAVNGLFWVATFWPVCGLARRMGGAPAAWFAGLALLAMPVYLGHAFINPKDLPMAAMTSWLAHVIAGVCGRGRLSWREALMLGVAYGAVLAVRPGGWFVGALLGLPLLAAGTHVSEGRWSFQWGPLLRSGSWLFAAGALAWIIMILPWPYAHQSPIKHPLEAMLYASRFDEVYPVMFAGRVLPSNELPWYYYLVYFGVTTPLVVLAAFLVGHKPAAGALRSGWGAAAASVGVLFLCWFPLTVFVVNRMNVYDGVRHFLFILPAAAVIAGVGTAWLARTITRWLPGPLANAAAAVALGSSLPSLFTLHPYQYVFYNALAGPRETLHQRWETDYWVTSYREAAQWIRQRTPATVENLNVMVAANDFCLPAFANYASAPLRVHPLLGDHARTPWPDGAACYVGTTRYGQWQNFAAVPVVHAIQRDGILMSVIRAPQPASP